VRPTLELEGCLQEESLSKEGSPVLSNAAQTMSLASSKSDSAEGTDGRH
jgi:hypothetical protein